MSAVSRGNYFFSCSNGNSLLRSGNGYLCILFPAFSFVFDRNQSAEAVIKTGNKMKGRRERMVLHSTVSCAGYSESMPAMFLRRGLKKKGRGEMTFASTPR